MNSIKLFKYGEVTTILLMVAIIDRTIALIRNRVISGE